MKRQANKSKKKQKQNEKVKFYLDSNQKCREYLGHIIEYTVKKNEILFDQFNRSLYFLKCEVERNGINLDDGVDIGKFLLVDGKKELDFNVGFQEAKLFSSAMTLLKNEIYNIIGDYDNAKRSISYNNYLSIINSRKIEDVSCNQSIEKTELINNFNLNRNYQYHFTSDKLVEWIQYRKIQARDFNLKFEHGSEFNIYTPQYINVKHFISEVQFIAVLLGDIKKVLQYMKEDFELLIGEPVTLAIKKENFDGSAEEISLNGFISHLNSNKR
jgi:hypothetical protein